MHIQVLSSGSEGNSTLIRAGEVTVLVDAGLGREAMLKRLESARLGPEGIGHVLVTHGHLDHSRSSGLVARRERATLHAAESQLTHPWARRAKNCAALAIGSEFRLAAKPLVSAGFGGARSEVGDEAGVRAVPIPHDCDPTVAFRFERAGRVAAILTDIGRPDADVARDLAGAHVLVLEFNYDPGMMARGPYPLVLQRRIAGGRGHLSNAQAGEMLERLASENLHTLVLAHISQKTNRADIALETAHATLDRLGIANRVRVIAAPQHEALPNLEV